MAFLMLRIGNDCFNRTNLNTLRLIKKTNTFGAQIRIYLINIITFRDGVIRTFIQTSTTGNAFFCNFNAIFTSIFKGHFLTS